MFYTLIFSERKRDILLIGSKKSLMCYPPKANSLEMRVSVATMYASYANHLAVDCVCISGSLSTAFHGSAFVFPLYLLSGVGWVDGEAAPRFLIIYN